MGKTLLLGGRGGASLSGTNYTPQLDGGVNVTNTEALEVAIPFRTAGTLSHLWIRVVTNDRTASSTFKLRQNGAYGNQVVTIGAGATGTFEDTTHTDTIAAGDTINAELVIGTGGTTFTSIIQSMLFDTPTTYCLPQGDLTSLNWTLASAQRFSPLGGLSLSTTIATVQAVLPGACSLQNLAVLVNANARTTATTFATNINSSAGQLTLTIGAGATGTFEDTTHTDTIAGGEKVCIEINSGAGTETLSMRSRKVEAISTGGSVPSAGASNVNSPGPGLNRFACLHITGNFVNESDPQATAQVACTLSHFNINITANTITATSTFTIRKNGADGNQTIAVGSGATGFFEDTSHVDVLGPTDLANINWITGATGTAISFRNFGMVMMYATVSPVTEEYSWQPALNTQDRETRFW